MNCDKFIDRLKNDFNLSVNLTDIKFVQCDIQPYNWLENVGEFGEKLCLLYSTEFIIFNTSFTIKILSFLYKTHAEVLKLEIQIQNNLLKNEVANCKNYLQRKRNLSLAFDVLLKIAKLQESRRLVYHTIFRKEKCLIVDNHENGMNIKCTDRVTDIKYFECNWKIDWKLDDYEVTDFIEFFCNNKPSKEFSEKMKRKMIILIKPNLIFNKKLKLWKKLIRDVNNHIKLHNRNIKKWLYYEISDDSDDNDNNLLRQKVEISDKHIIIID